MRVVFFAIQRSFSDGLVSGGITEEGSFASKYFHSPLVVRATLECCGDHTHTQADRGEIQSMNKSTRYTIKGISPDRGENQRKKSKVPTASEPILYYLTMIRAITWYTLTLHYVDF